MLTARPQLPRDGKGLYLATDRGSEFRRLTHIDLATMRARRWRRRSTGMSPTSSCRALTRWTTHEPMPVAADKFVEPQRVRWKSFDERDPAMREFLQSNAPLNNAARITKPLFVIQGRNDPRVPYQEADQNVATLKKSGTPAWYMSANNEGHGFAKKANADYQSFATANFRSTSVLK